MEKPLLMEWDDDAEDYEEVIDADPGDEFWEDAVKRIEAAAQAKRKAQQQSPDDASS